MLLTCDTCDHAAKTSQGLSGHRQLAHRELATPAGEEWKAVVNGMVFLAEQIGGMSGRLSLIEGRIDELANPSSVEPAPELVKPVKKMLRDLDERAVTVVRR